MTRPGKWCERCNRQHIETIVKWQGSYWLQRGPHTTRHDTAEQAFEEANK